MIIGNEPSAESGDEQLRSETKQPKVDGVDFKMSYPLVIVSGLVVEIDLAEIFDPTAHE